MRAALFAAILLAYGSPAFAQPASGVTGLWDGSVGDLPVSVCFNEASISGMEGMYFYRSRLVTIPLKADGESGLRFSEDWPNDAKAARWSLSRAGEMLEGIWTHGSKTLPIRLTNVPFKGDDAPCASLAFHQPRLKGIHVVRSEASKDGVPYTKLVLDLRGHFPSVSVESFELHGDARAIRTINTVLAKHMQDRSWLECIQAAGIWGGDWNESMEPRLISRRLLVTNHHWDGFCGGAHPDSSNDARTFDLTTGSEIDITEWFTSKAFETIHNEGESSISRTMRTALRKVVIGRSQGEEDCRDVVSTAEWWDLELTRKGITFTPVLGHAVQACEESYSIPFARLIPFLTPDGRRQVTSVQTERQARR